MTALDYLVLIIYFLGMAGIGLWAMRKIKKQEDFFMGGRGFGKLLQTFAAFGAGTGSADPINTASTSFRSGLSGMWSVMYWLFVTPVYWISGVWYRRMRHLTLGDWFVERYESKPLGVAYSIFGLLFYIVYMAMLFTAIGKFTSVMFEVDTIVFLGMTMKIEQVLVGLIAVIVAVYGVLGGITAAYWTDLIQGVCIVVLSILLLPFGLNALVAEFGDPETMGMMDGFRIMHEQVPASQFAIVGTSSASEFPLYRIAAIVFINIVGAVVMPHFIVTGGGSAKTEFNARVGFVTGNLLKRFCTVGWAITALIALALFADNAELVADPDKVWGMASKELLGPGLVGLMLACLLAALMSSADCYMLVCSGLVVRNIYAAYINDEATDQQYIRLGRIIGVVIIVCAVLMSWKMNDVYGQLKLTWIVQVAFAAPFWLGLFWRGATRIGAWCAIAYCALVFFLIPFIAPMVAPDLRSNPRFTLANERVVSTEMRAAAPSDVRKGAARKVGDEIEVSTTSGGKLIYFTGTLDDEGKASGNFKIDYLLYDIVGMDLTKKSNAMLDTLSLLPKVILPFLIMILVSLFTRKNSRPALDRYYVKMKTPVLPDPAEDRVELEKSYADPGRFDHRKLFPNSSLEIQIPTREDWVGFVLTIAACFGVIGLVMLVAGIGG